MAKKKEMLINVLQPEECRIAIVENGLLEELYLERTSQESYVGNIYRGRIVNIEPSIQAAFVDFGVGRNGFLHVSDVDPHYYSQRSGRGRDDLIDILELPEVPDVPGPDDLLDEEDNEEPETADANARAEEEGDEAEPLAPEAEETLAEDALADAESFPEERPPDAITERRPPLPRGEERRRDEDRRDEGRGRRGGGRRGRRGGRGGRSDRERGRPRHQEPREYDVLPEAEEALPPGTEVTTSLELSTPVTPDEFDDLPPPRPRPRRSPAPAMPSAERRTEEAADYAGLPPETPAEPLPVIDTGKSSQFIDYSSFGRSVLGDLEPPPPPAPPPSQVVSLAPVDRAISWTPETAEPPPGGAAETPAFSFPERPAPPVMDEAEVVPDYSEPQPGPHRPRRDHRRRRDREPDRRDPRNRPASHQTDAPRERNGGTEPFTTDAIPPRMAEELMDDDAGDRASSRGWRSRDMDEGEGPEEEAGSNWNQRPRGRRSPRPALMRQKPPIQEIFRRGQEVLVQVIKEGIGTKGPTLSTYISIPGRYLVLMPGLNRIGVSRKIQDEDQRYRLRDLLRELKPPKGLGFIIRTAGVDRTKKELLRDLHYLTRLWNVIVRRIRKTRGPSMIYQESDMITRTIRDVFSSDIEAIYVDEPKAHEHAKEFLQFVMPRYVDRLHLDTGSEPLFHRFGLEKEINRIQQRRIPLPGGGSIVIDQTEALVAIDVNSGNHRVDNDAEETAYRVNLAAAREIARQLRLRDLGGVIVIDFIDMREERHRRDVERTLRDAIRRDRARTKPLRMSQFGIIEMTRQRIRPSLERSSLQDCPSCGGSGQVKTSESMSIEVMRLLHLAVHRTGIARVQVRVADAVAQYLLNRKRREIAELEEAGKLQVTILGVPHAQPEMLEVECQDHLGGDIRIQEQEILEPRPRTHRGSRQSGHS